LVVPATSTRPCESTAMSASWKRKPCSPSIGTAPPPPKRGLRRPLGRNMTIALPLAATILLPRATAAAILPGANSKGILYWT
jgi:hypothetical protein